MRAFILSLIFLFAAVACLVQATVAGYDSQFRPPGPVSTWQVRAETNGREVVTVWGQDLNLPTDELSVVVRRAGPYVERVLDIRDLFVRGQAGLSGRFPARSGGFR